MFIDTWSRDTLETSVARCLNRTIPEIYSEIEKSRSSVKATRRRV